jgi:tRNA pseudouridine38-40 synthase
VNYRLVISYRGTAYAGWQRQTNATAVQQVVEEALGALLDQPTRVFGAGRTDAGVHARGQVAHLERTRPMAPRALVHGGNHRLPADVRILAADVMPDGFHARKAALGKEYRYRVFRGRVVSPLDEPWVWRVERPLRLDAVRQALGVLPGVHDFTAFALAGGSHGQPRRRLFAATAEEHGRELHFRFTGDGFLRGMVRSLVGTLVEIGTGRRSPDSMTALLQGRPRSEAGVTAPACGLCLEQVFYPPRWLPREGYRG